MNRDLVRSRIKLALLSIVVGLLSGSASALFLFLLKVVTDYRSDHSEIIYLLPIAGFLIGWVYLKYGKNSEAGSSLIFEEVHDPKMKVPLRMAPFVLFGTIVTHLFGGSAGREGTAVQMGASLADHLAHMVNVDKFERRVLLVAGMGSGFGSAVGAPWAGVVFGLEALSIGRFHFFALIECIIASWIGYWAVGAWGVEHTQYFMPEIPAWSFHIFWAVVIAGIAFGFTAMAFSKFTHFIEHLNKRFISYSPLRPLIAGVVLVLLYLLIGNFRYSGLGLPVINEALKGPVSFFDPLLKSLLTSLTIGSGFKGGEFIPLVFVGSTLGSVIGNLLSVSSGFLAALGFAAVFGAASNTPITCAIMASEIFGIEISSFAFLACILSYYCSGHQGIYKKQKTHIKKQDQLVLIFKNLFHRKKTLQ